MEVGLAVLATLVKPGQSVSHRAIAEVCGCSRGLIFLIEKQALKKVRERLRKELHLTHAEFHGPNTTETTI